MSDPFYPFSINITEALTNIYKVIEALDRHGLVHIPNFLSQEELSAIDSEVDLALEKHPNENYSAGRMAAIGEGHDAQFDNFPAISELMHSLFMSNLSSLFFHGNFILNNEAYITHEFRLDRGLAGNAHLHFDRFQRLKFLLYLQDTTKASGAFSCVPSTHRIGQQLREQEWSKKTTYKEINNKISLEHPHLGMNEDSTVAVEGGKGTLIMLNTDVLHLGGRISEGTERKIIRGHTKSSAVDEKYLMDATRLSGVEVSCGG